MATDFRPDFHVRFYAPSLGEPLMQIFFLVRAGKYYAPGIVPGSHSARGLPGFPQCALSEEKKIKVIQKKCWNGGGWS
jgi:hypothetical protein